jgi:hypothetical protein
MVIKLGHAGVPRRGKTMKLSNCAMATRRKTIATVTKYTRSLIPGTSFHSQSNSRIAVTRRHGNVILLKIVSIRYPQRMTYEDAVEELMLVEHHRRPLHSANSTASSVSARTTVSGKSRTSGSPRPCTGQKSDSL